MGKSHLNWCILECPRAYFLKNVYKDPKTGHKVIVMSPYLALGQAVHEVIESLSVLPTDKRFLKPLTKHYDDVWKKIPGKIGGFTSDTQEKDFKERGRKMLVKVMDNPGILKNLAVKIKTDTSFDLPYFWLSEEENIILCGKIDWIEYLPKTDSVHIVDFKTGKGKEYSNSLHLPIYLVLAKNTQLRDVEKMSYWYVARNDKPTKQVLPDYKKSKAKILKIAKEIKLARSLERFPCPHKTGCRACKPHEKILRGEAEFVGVNEFKQDVYIINGKENNKDDKKSVIL